MVTKYEWATNKFKSGGLHEKHVVATWDVGTISAFAYRHKETKRNLCRGGRSQDLPDTVFCFYYVQKIHAAIYIYMYEIYVHDN
jgi:hypothetical protein